MNTNSAIFDELTSFVEEYRYTYPFKLERTTSLYPDMNIYGDDAVEFILAFSKKFGVDVSNFMLASYVPPEELPVFTCFKELFGKAGQIKELTLGHLEAAIRKGKLDEAVIAKESLS